MLDASRPDLDLLRGVKMVKETGFVNSLVCILYHRHMLDRFQSDKAEATQKAVGIPEPRRQMLALTLRGIYAESQR